MSAEETPTEIYDGAVADLDAWIAEARARGDHYPANTISNFKREYFGSRAARARRNRATTLSDVDLALYDPENEF